MDAQLPCRAFAPSLPALHLLMLFRMRKVSHDEAVKSVLCYGITSWFVKDGSEDRPKGFFLFNFNRVHVIVNSVVVSV